MGSPHGALSKTLALDVNLGGEHSPGQGGRELAPQLPPQARRFFPGEVFLTFDLFGGLELSCVDLSGVREPLVRIEPSPDSCCLTPIRSTSSLSRDRGQVPCLDCWHVMRTLSCLRTGGPKVGLLSGVRDSAFSNVTRDLVPFSFSLLPS